MKQMLSPLAVATLLAACASSSSSSPPGGAETESASQPAAAAEPDAGATIVGVAQNAGTFDTLVTAVKAAGLAEALSGEGPFTVFAPTDDAFAALPEGTLDDLLKPENSEKLANILKYHVVPGKVMANQVVNVSSADTLLGEKLEISTEGDAVMVNDANVVKTDVAASNGVIHVVDKVILPPS